MPDRILMLHKILAKYIVDRKPETVFEFGCNWGMNLRNILDLEPDIYVSGIDVNRLAVARGREAPNLNIMLGDENSLVKKDLASEEIVFTCSVLNHFPEEQYIKTQSLLKGISDRELILMECSNPWEHPRWFAHNYAKQGFKKLYETKVGPNQYELWSWMR